MPYFTYFTYIWHFVKFATKRCSYPEPKPKACPQYGKHFELHIVTWPFIYALFTILTYLLILLVYLFVKLKNSEDFIEKMEKNEK